MESQASTNFDDFNVMERFSTRLSNAIAWTVSTLAAGPQKTVAAETEADQFRFFWGFTQNSNPGRN